MHRYKFFTFLTHAQSFAAAFTKFWAEFNATTVSATISLIISAAGWLGLFTEPATTPIGLFDVRDVWQGYEGVSTTVLTAVQQHP
jgi:hypothetical protein